MSNDVAETDKERERLRNCTSEFIFFANFQAEKTRDIVSDVRSSATGINQGICIKRFFSIDDGNWDNLENGEKNFGNFIDSGSVKMWLPRGFFLVLGTLKLC